MANNSQLARIVAPNINEADYADKMQSAFNNINENFKKIASLPFLQGVKGDSYVIKEHIIWTPNLTLSSDGAILLNSIFGTNFQEDNLFSACKASFDSIKINGKTPIDDFVDKNYNLQNNILYFYSIIDDSGHETQKQLGQYYYFIDSRISEIGNVYNTNPSSLSNFVDYSGFYCYVPADPEHQIVEHYEKTTFLPSIYYDSTKNDICWEFKGVRTGISAIGVAGKDGKNANFEYVEVLLENIGDTTGIITGLFKYNELNTTTNHWNTNQDVINTLKDGDNVLICMKYDATYLNFAFGQVKENGNTRIAVWNSDTQLNTIITDEFVTEYFNNIGKNGMPADPRYFGIPMYIDRTNIGGTDKTKAHVITTSDYPGGTVLPDLIFRHMTGVFENGTPTRDDDKRNLILDNYNLKVKKVKLDSNGDEYSTSTKYTEITDDKIVIAPTDNSQTNTTIGSTGISTGTGNFRNDINVVGNAKAKVNNVGGVYLGCPIGTIVMWAGINEPDGWELCKGQSIKLVSGAASTGHTTYRYNGNLVHIDTDYLKYETLVNTIIGNNDNLNWPYGDNGSGILFLPNLQQKFPLGANGGTISIYPTSLGSIGGEATHLLSAAESGLPTHNHELQRGRLVGSGDSETVINGAGVTGTDIVNPDADNKYTKSTGGTGAQQAHNNVPPFLAINFIIKYK